MTGSQGSQDSLAKLVHRARWYRNRLAAMSGGEIAHRVGEMVHRQISKHHTFAAFQARHPWRCAPRLARPGRKVGRLAADSGLMSRWTKHRETVANCRFEFLGIVWPHTSDAGAMPDWHLDPVTGDRWPADEFCFDIPYRHADAFGDVKNVWELSRLQYLQPLAAYARIAEDSEATRLCLDHLVSWIDENPAFRGVNWPSMIEVAFRIISMSVITTLLGDHMNDAQRRKVAGSLYQHGWWIARFPSKYSSGNNHLVAEAAALYVLGSLMPHLPGADRWRIYGQRELERAAENQIASDGVGREQSPAYLALTLEWLLLSGDLGRRTGKPFSSTFWQRISRAGEFLKWMTDSGGHQPHIGDDDDSHVFGNGMRDRTDSQFDNGLYRHCRGRTVNRAAGTRFPTCAMRCSRSRNPTISGPRA